MPFNKTNCRLLKIGQNGSKEITFDQNSEYKGSSELSLKIPE